MVKTTLPLAPSAAPVPQRRSDGVAPLRVLDYSLFTLLLGLGLIAPGHYSYLKIAIFAIFVPVRLFHIVHEPRPWSFWYSIAIPALFSLVGLLYCIYGYAEGNPGAFRVTSVYVAYPALLGFLAATVTRREAERLVDLLFTISMATSGAIVVLLFLLLAGFDVTAWIKDSAFNMGDEGYSRMSFKVIDSLNFIVPFVVPYALLAPGGKRFGVYMLVVPLVTLASLVSGRRAQWVLVVLSALGPILLGKVKPARILILSAGFAVGVAVAFVSVHLNFETLKDYLMKGLDFTVFSADLGGQARGDQLVALTTGFLDKPFFGHGLGATASAYGSVQDFDAPWSYELLYNYHLFALGAVGFLFYGCGVIWLGYNMYQMSRNPYYTTRAFALLSGFTGFMIGTSVNPWLSKFDFMYVIFIPYAFIVGLRENAQRGAR